MTPFRREDYELLHCVSLLIFSRQLDILPMSCFAPLAQLVEQLPLKQTVAGSNPARRTKVSFHHAN